MLCLETVRLQTRPHEIVEMAAIKILQEVRIPIWGPGMWWYGGYAIVTVIHVREQHRDARSKRERRLSHCDKRNRDFQRLPRGVSSHVYCNASASALRTATSFRFTYDSQIVDGRHVDYPIKPTDALRPWEIAC
jgi:hypothetical protein